VRSFKGCLPEEAKVDIGSGDPIPCASLKQQVRSVYRRSPQFRPYHVPIQRSYTGKTLLEQLQTNFYELTQTAVKRDVK